MNTTIPGGEFINGAMDVISQSLTLPVMIILLLMVVIIIIILGSVIEEYTSRKKTPVDVIEKLIYDINNSLSDADLKRVISKADIDGSQKIVLEKITDAHSLKRLSREALARKLVEAEEENIEKRMKRTDIITRVGPTLGLMGTLIPMGQGLAALGAGDINTLASSLTVAFNTTIVGIGCGALAYVIGKIRREWYDKYLSDLDALTDAVLDRLD